MISRLVVAVVALGATAWLGVAPAAADVDDFEFESMHVDYTLVRDADGTSRLTVVETLVAVFPAFDQNRGIVRDIPTDVWIAEGSRVDIGVAVRSVTDETGAPVPYAQSGWTDFDGTRFVSLALGTDEFVHGRTTYVIEWTAHSVVHSPADSDVPEFYWDVNGTGWRQPFGSVTADLHLGAGLAEVLTGATACYAGYAGETTPCELGETADGFTIDAGPLLGSQTATIAIGFEPGAFREPTPVERTWPFTVLPWVLLGVLVAAALVAVVLRRTLWGHAPGRGVIIPEYEGPEGLGVMPAATLIGRAKTAFPAQLVRLAVEGAVNLVEDPDERDQRRFRLDVLDASAVADDDLLALQRLFGTKARDGESLVLDRRNRKLGDRVATLTGIMSGLPRSRGYLARGKRSPLRRLIFWPAVAVLVGTVGLIVWCGIQNVASGTLTIVNIVLILGSFVVMGFSGRPERRTAKGTAAYEKLLGLRDYLTLAEADRLRVLQSPQGAVRERIDPNDAAAVVKLDERLLPWAIVWGVEKQWTAQLAARYGETMPPSTHLSLSSGLSGIATLSGALPAAAFATTPIASSSSGSGSSSFSSGSSGGGSSGGGGGGGGGGGR